MEPQEFIDKWLGWAKNKEEINDEILADLDAMNQALRIHDVVGQGEQFYCDQEKIIKRCKNQCMRCNKLWKPKKQ